MDVLLSVVQLLAVAAPVGLAAAWFSGRGADAMSSLFRSERGLGWPRGVQEEDPVAWDWDRGAAAARDAGSDTHAVSTAVEPVVFRVGRGAARRRQRGREVPLPR